MKATREKPGKNILLSMLAGIHLSALPIYSRFPWAVILFIILLSLWQFFIISQNRKNSGRIFQILVILLSFLTILYSYGHIFGQQPGIALVTLMTLLKLFETWSARDCYVIIYSAFFVIASNFFHSQSLWLIIYVFFVVSYLLSILIALSDRLHTLSFQHRFRMASRFIFYAMPFMLILFVLFPRIPGPLWVLPDDAFSSKTGLSEEMSPGSINSLISSSAIAFRVTFDDAIPSHNQRYWRGAVLSDYDGRTWRRHDAPASAIAKVRYAQDNKDIFRYTVTLEPTNLSWLLSLEYPIVEINTTQYSLSRELMLRTKNKINNPVNYRLMSQSNASNQALFQQENIKNQTIPSTLNPRTAAFARQLYISSGYDSRRYITNVLSYFRNNSFVYTLNPDLLGDNAMDDFLFTTRRGFCEHYASAFTYLMRAASLPARVIIGYQGGEMNPMDDYMIVRQSDAHAWSEVWIDNHWQRFDPTAAVSPDRIEQGVMSAGLETNQLPLLLSSDNRLIKNFTFLFDSFQNSWNQWVIGFNQKKQKDLLKALGFDQATTSDLILLLVAGLSITGLFIAWLLLSHNTVEKDRVQHYYSRFTRKLKRHGISRQPHEGPTDFENRVYLNNNFSVKTRNDMAYIFMAYRKLHYGGQINDKLLEAYIKKVKTFKLRKKK
ncbi:MAG: DUF3488 and transglutaminase-like domain-containing protein [Gammaproteobacteria bacterium]|nr:DUF3488 and transglutaminase-like domain-containing protein [Gammaproteobacteria bacterium]